MDSKKLIRKLWKRFPIKIAKKYHDYVGLMVSKIHEETHKIIVCLDVSPLIVEKAIQENVDLIISHHPFIYGKKKYVLLNPYKNEMYQKLLEKQIPVYSFHTNFDEGVGGMNDALASALELNEITPIENCPMGRKGLLKEAMRLEDFTKFALKKLHIEYGSFIGDKDTLIRTIGIVGGAGSRDCFAAYEDGCDVFISGDTPYHIRKELLDTKKNYIHLDHEIEKIFIPTMKKILLDIDENLEVIELDDVVQATLMHL